jgi:hypothetical protein
MMPLARGTALGFLLALASNSIDAQRSDTTVIRAGSPLHPGVATLVEEVTLGNGSDAEEYIFTSVGLRSGSDGSLYVIDRMDMASSVRQYDRAGKLVRAFGRNGQGPGEYIALVGDVRELPDSRVLLSDARGILVYSRAGEPLGRWNGRARAANFGSQILVDPSGFVLTNGVKPRDGDPPTMLDDARTHRHPDHVPLSVRRHGGRHDATSGGSVSRADSDRPRVAAVQPHVYHRLELARLFRHGVHRELRDRLACAGRWRRTPMASR